MKTFMPVNERCLVCKSPSLKKLTRYSDNFLVKCKNCGLVFCEKIPTKQELDDYYKVYAYDSNYYSPITKQRYIELLESFEKYRKTNKILDVGCGNGFFLETAKEKGWEVYGTEYSAKAVEVLNKKNIKTFYGVLNTKHFEKEMFDVITSFEVIEHINNPLEELEKFTFLLRKNGVLYITTPNFNSISRYLLKEKWNIIKYPEHLTYYNAKTLDNLLKLNGFKKIYIKTTGFSLSRLKQSKSGDSEKNNKSNVQQNIDENLRQKIEKNKFLSLSVNIINSILNLLKKGDTIKALYIKN